MRISSCKIELFVENLQRSIEFYETVLGFESGETRFVERDGQRLNHTPLRNGPILIALGAFEDLSDEHHFRRGEASVPKGIGTEFCFYVPSSKLDSWYERVLETYDKLSIERLRLRPWGARDFRVIDPDGYYLRISEPDKDA